MDETQTRGYADEDDAQSNFEWLASQVNLLVRNFAPGAHPDFDYILIVNFPVMGSNRGLVMSDAYADSMDSVRSMLVTVVENFDKYKEV